MIRGIKVLMKVPCDMKISEFWDNVVEKNGYTEDGDFAIVYVKSTDMTDNELLIHSPFGSFVIMREIDAETKELIDVYEIESSDLNIISVCYPMKRCMTFCVR